MKITLFYAIVSICLFFNISTAISDYDANLEILEAIIDEETNEGRAIVSLYDPDVNSSSSSQNLVNITISGWESTTLRLIETGNDTGSFLGTIGMGGASTIINTRISAGVGDTITVTFTDDPDASGGISVVEDTAEVVAGSLSASPTPSVTPTSSTVSTEVSGKITSDTKWKKENSPYLVTGNILVNEGITLTIEEGVTIKLEEGKTLQIEGQIVARGKEGKEIIFTTSSKKDDDYWNYIYLSNTSIGATFDSNGNYQNGTILEYCIIENASGSDDLGDGAVIINGTNPYINHCTIQNNYASGIYAYNVSGVFKITACVINNNIPYGAGGGIYISGSIEQMTVTISDCTIEDNKTSYDGSWGFDGGGIYLYSNNQDDIISIYYNKINNNSAFSGRADGGGIYIPGNNGGHISIYNNTISGNDGSGIYIPGNNGGLISIYNNTISGNDSNGICSYAETTIYNNILNNNESGYGTIFISSSNNKRSTISSNMIFNNNSGIVSSGNTDITNNIICDNSVSGTYGEGGAAGITCSDGDSFEISVNHIIRNTTSNYSVAAGIYISGSNGTTIKNNTITDNNSEETSDSYIINVKDDISLNYNNIFNNTAKYELYNDNSYGSNDVNAQNNWWGSTNISDIEKQIYDWADDSDKGFVDYEPFETDIIIDAPISPPSVISVSGSNNSITLNWTSNPESDVAGYKIYWGTSSGYIYENSIDAGNVTKYTITDLDNTKYYVAVTAYDIDYDISNDTEDTITNENMTNGNESWYSAEEEVSVTAESTSTPIPTLIQTPTPVIVSTLTPTPISTPKTTPTPLVIPTSIPTPTKLGALFGSVVDTDGKPIANATVSTDTGGYSTKTGSNGIYQLNDVAEGIYILTALAEGYGSVSQTVTVKAGETTQADFTLLRAATIPTPVSSPSGNPIPSTTPTPVTSKGKIFGYVADETNSPVKKAKVRCKGKNSNYKEVVKTNKEGYFELNDLDADTYKITAKKKGYYKSIYNVNIETGEEKEIEMLLEEK